MKISKPLLKTLFIILFTIGLTNILSNNLCAQEKPNIIFILGDDMGYNSIGAFGQELIKTPNLDKLAKKGMKLTNFYTNQMCSPSRGSFFTGMHAGHGLIRGNYELGGFKDEDEYGQMPLTPNMQTLGTELKKAGYKTALTGKWGMGGPGSTGVPNKQGIDFFFGYLCQKQAHNYYPTHLWNNEVLFPLNNTYFDSHQKLPTDKDPNLASSYLPYEGKEYSADVIQKQAINFIKQQKKGQPFFLEIAHTLPHMGLQVPERIRKQYIGKFKDEKPYTGSNGYLPNQYPLSTYAAMITLLDEYIGEVLKTLDEKGLNNTVVIFTADNGAAKAGGVDSDYFNSSGNQRGRKGSIYEGGIKVPFVAYWPGVIKPGTSSNHISAIWDLMPTFLDMAGYTVPKNLDGISMLNALKQKEQKKHEFLYWERHTDKDVHEEAVRFGDWKAIRNVRQDKVSLYNLNSDPSEKEDVSATHPELIVKARSYFATRRTAAVTEWNYGKASDF